MMGTAQEGQLSEGDTPAQAARVTGQAPDENSARSSNQATNAARPLQEDDSLGYSLQEDSSVVSKAPSSADGDAEGEDSLASSDSASDVQQVSISVLRKHMATMGAFKLIECEWQEIFMQQCFDQKAKSSA